MSYLIITPRPFPMFAGFMLGLFGGFMPGVALAHQLPAGWDWLRTPLVMTTGLAGLWLGTYLAQSREQVSWVAGELLVQPLGWQRYLRPARSVAREQVKSYLVEWVRGEQLRLRLHDGKKILFGPGPFWGWGRSDQEAFLAAIIPWLEAAPLPTRPQSELTFWARPVGTILLAFMTLVVGGFTVFGLSHGLAPGKSWWGALPVYITYLTMLLSWRSARKQKRTD